MDDRVVNERIARAQARNRAAQTRFRQRQQACVHVVHAVLCMPCAVHTPGRHAFADAKPRAVESQEVARGGWVPGRVVAGCPLGGLLRGLPAASCAMKSMDCTGRWIAPAASASSHRCIHQAGGSCMPAPLPLGCVLYHPGHPFTHQTSVQRPAPSFHGSIVGSSHARRLSRTAAACRP